MTTARVVIGDCRVVLTEWEPNCVDAIVCDPPYDLLSASRNGSGRSNEPDNPYGRHGSNGGGFMGLAWDATGVAFDPETWRIAMRVLKPGGHLVAFGGTRTFHRLTCAIEDAGFEIRDVLCWLYGSGFPKSLDVSKAIDKAAGAEREPMGQRVRRGDRKPYTDTAKSNTYGQVSGYGGLTDRPATPDAETWGGWGTALKPGWEPIILARKPLSEANVAANVLRWGTGALNVDGCRITYPEGGRPSDSTWSKNARRGEQGGGVGGWGYKTDGATIAEREHLVGRWPANVALDEEVAGLLDEQSGALTSGANPTRRGTDKFRGIYAAFPGQEECEPARSADIGGASRFFYTAKASRSERELSKCACYNQAVWGGADRAVSTSPGTGTRPRRGTTGSTSTDDSVWPMTLFGNDNTGQSPTDSKSTTLTETSKTIASPTSSSLIPLLTNGSTADANLETGLGGSHAASAPNSNQSALSTGTSAAKVGLSTDVAGPATSASSYETNKNVARCPNCGRLVRSSHPTVKPIALLRWLCRMVTPPHGHVLDPFAGSGSTLVAALQEGFEATGIELLAEYANGIADQRINGVQIGGLL